MLVQGDSPRVLTLVTECFEASLFLLVKQKTVDNDQVGIHQGGIMHMLRAKAMNWFYEDHLFYEAAVGQFRQHLTASNVKPSIVKDCKLRLDESAVLNKKILLDTGLHDGRMHQAGV
jgi:hypothetical protein